MRMNDFLNETKNKTERCDFDCQVCGLYKENDCLLREPENWTIEFKPNKYAEIEKTLMYDKRTLFKINEENDEDEKTDTLLYILLCLVAFMLVLIIAILSYMYFAFRGGI